MTKTIQFNYSEIEYQLTGKKQSETILFLHGLGANLSQFQHQHAYFSKDYRVISVNLRGHGQSKIFSKLTPAEFELYEMALDIIELLEALSINQVHFVGNSMGGNVGYEILKVRPNLFSSFTTFGTTAHLNNSKLTIRMMSFAYRILTTKAIGNLAKVSGQTNKSKEKIKEMMVQIDKVALLSILSNIANFDYLSVIKTSSIPSMIITGELDQDINRAIENTIAEFEERGNFKMVEMQGAGHFANLDDPDRFNQILGEFIRNKCRVTTCSM